MKTAFRLIMIAACFIEISVDCFLHNRSSLFYVAFYLCMLFSTNRQFAGETIGYRFLQVRWCHLSLVASFCVNGGEHVKQLWLREIQWSQLVEVKWKLWPIRFCSYDYIVKIFHCLLNSVIPSVNKRFTFFCLTQTRNSFSKSPWRA
jgi:hypothetical protein